MWIETKYDELLNMDCVSSIGIFCTTYGKPPYEIHAHMKGVDNGVLFGKYPTLEETTEEYQKLKNILIPDNNLYIRMGN